MQKKWLWGGVAISAVLAGIGVWVNLTGSQGLPEGFAGGNGRLELQRMDVATLYAGRVVALPVDEGDEVAPNAVLAELSSDQSSSQLAGAEAAKQRAQEAVARADAEIAAQRQQQKTAQMELDNTRRLKNEALVSAAEVQRREAARDAAAAAVKAAQAGRAARLAGLPAHAATNRRLLRVPAPAGSDARRCCAGPRRGPAGRRLP